MMISSPSKVLHHCNVGHGNTCTGVPESNKWYNSLNSIYGTYPGQYMANSARSKMAFFEFRNDAYNSRVLMYVSNVKRGLKTAVTKEKYLNRASVKLLHKFMRVASLKSQYLADDERFPGDQLIVDLNLPKVSARRVLQGAAAQPLKKMQKIPLIQIATSFGFFVNTVSDTVSKGLTFYGLKMGTYPPLKLRNLFEKMRPKMEETFGTEDVPRTMPSPMLFEGFHKHQQMKEQMSFGTQSMHPVGASALGANDEDYSDDDEGPTSV